MEQTLSKSEAERRARVASAKGRKIKKLVIWLVVLILMAGGSWWLLDFSRSADERKPGEAIPDIGREHLTGGQEVTSYNSNPPTSGPHYAQPAAWGIYEEELQDEQLVHNLEHGGVWISYKDKDNPELIDQLKDIADDYSVKVIMTYRPKNDSRIAVAAWGRLLELESFDKKQIEDFIKAFINKGPEQVPF